MTTDGLASTVDKKNIGTKSWVEMWDAFLEPAVIRMLFLGFSAGIPILLIFSSLSLWLGEAGLKKSSITFFSWAALGYSFKFVWAPLVDKLPIPFLKSWLGQRRSWLLVAQLSIVGAILWMAFTNPADGNASLTTMALAAVLLGFSSATQDIVIDAYRIESSKNKDLQALMSSTYIVGYRIGMIVAGAGALYLAAYFGTTKEHYQYDSWMWTYMIMAGTMAVGIITTFVISEPDRGKLTVHSTVDYLRFLLMFMIAVAGFIALFFYSGDLVKGVKLLIKVMTINTPVMGLIIETVRLLFAIIIAVILAKLMIVFHVVNKEMVIEAYIEPIREFFVRYGKSVAILLLLLVGLYRISDIVLGAISNVFYQDMGFLKQEIASGVKVWGVIAAIFGGFMGGALSIRYGVLKVLFAGAVISAATNLLFMLLAKSGHDLTMFYIVISADNFAAGFAGAAFIAFLSSLTNISFTAMQYAIFSSLMTLLPKTLGGYSGSIVEGIGYSDFFLLTALLGLPVLILIWLANKYLSIKS